MNNDNQIIVLNMINERLENIKKLNGNDIIAMQNEILECKETLEYIKSIFIYLVI